MLIPSNNPQRIQSNEIRQKNERLADAFKQLRDLWNVDQDPNDTQRIADVVEKIKQMPYDVGDLIEKEGPKYIRIHSDWKDLSGSFASDLKLLASGLSPEQALENRLKLGL